MANIKEITQGYIQTKVERKSYEWGVSTLHATVRCFQQKNLGLGLGCNLKISSMATMSLE